jgi:DNA polymerase-3 subunit delta
MQLRIEDLTGHLQRQLAPIYVVSGDEPLLVQECGDLVREAARKRGYNERQLLTVEPGFDWNGLFNETQSMSLFSERRLLELRLPTGKPGETGAKILIELAGRPPADVVILITTGKLERAQREAKWVKALTGAGVHVTVYPVEASQLAGWIDRRMRARGLRPEAGVVELLAHHMEGNLSACAQEIDKLAMLGGEGAVRLDDIETALCDNARFNVFGLADQCLRGDPVTIIRILRSLRAEGVEAVLIHWALTRELRELVRLSEGIAAGQSAARVFETHHVWPRRKPLLQKALARHNVEQWRALLVRAARVDRIVKGRQRGDVWHELECLALEISGAKTLSEENMKRWKSAGGYW